MRATTTPALFTRPRNVAASVAAAALALTLVPGSASAQQADTEPVDVRLKVADAAPVEVATTPQAWPGELLEAYGVSVDGNDLVDVVRDGDEVSGERKRLRQGDVVRLTDVVKERKTKRERVRRGTVEVFTTELKPGVRKVVREGRPGTRVVVARKTFHNGEPVKYRVIKRKLVKDPRPRRVLVGREAYAVAGANGLNWGALANCESGGNPDAVNPAGYYGLYQFDLGTWRSVGGSGLPTSASAGEQTYRAKLLYKQRGRSPWPTCGRLL
ncbi:G5 domain-containing protein [Nocardioides alpinus]|uniref:G5 domain-containing protein n=1 Tax=Nocardioides alpinus TaxID=748909 RepID=A0A1I0ZRX6_9ACTN|nr:resuscitation-promoting factor [Nocardioides alpinus]PKH41843.1 transglycosylase [Nocardioides alpinus]SFB28261.1 G5 domain-containing protein [Nocardioides alpinus]